MSRFMSFIKSKDEAYAQEVHTLTSFPESINPVFTGGLVAGTVGSSAA